MQGIPNFDITIIICKTQVVPYTAYRIKELSKIIIGVVRQHRLDIYYFIFVIILWFGYIYEPKSIDMRKTP